MIHDRDVRDRCMSRLQGLAGQPIDSARFADATTDVSSLIDNCARPGLLLFLPRIIRQEAGGSHLVDDLSRVVAVAVAVRSLEQVDRIYLTEHIGQVPEQV